MGCTATTATTPTWSTPTGKAEPSPQPQKAGTGDALFRNPYRDFLAQCAGLLDSGHLRTGHTLYAEAAVLWTEATALTRKAGESEDVRCLVQAGASLGELARLEREALQALLRLGNETPSTIRP